MITYISRTFAIAHEIIRHNPDGGVTRPNASDTMPTIAKWTGSMCTDRASGSRIVPTMMMAGIASRKHPTTRKQNAMKKPVVVMPMSHAATPASSAFGIW